ncbi:MAG TPA: FAD-dependent oxidoreductase [Terricaulis sp.]|nr:FAD-dependent oxidoreductase [Terricaulis sp.]
MMHTRRTMMALSGAGLASACASLRTPDPRNRLPPVRVEEARIIRIDVGLRPFRPSGFRVAREAFGDKALIHNYGHGGGGITLSWGTAKLALDLGYDSSVAEYAVLGCGAVGLATARLLQERGAKVRLYARALPPNTTSNVAGAQWWPASVYDYRATTPEYRAQHVEASRFAFRRFQSFVGDAYGVSWEKNYNLSARPITSYPAREDDPMRQFVINQRDLLPHEHNFPRPFVREFETMMIETPLYLRRMEADVRLAGAEIVVREFASAAEIQALPERVIFNCTGLGAGALFGDNEIMPARGQLAILLPQPEIAYNTIAREGYMFGRRDGIVLGGTFERGEWSLEPDPADIAEIIAGHQSIFGAMS